MNGAGAVDQAKPSLIGGLGFYFSGEDAIRITSWNSLSSVAVLLAGRFVNVDGHVEPFLDTHAPATNRTATSQTFPRGCGYLTDLTAIVSGATPQLGQTFIRVDVVRGLGSSQIVLGTLLQGYVTATTRLAFPGSPINDSLTGRGALRSITGTNPAAGAQFSETVPTGARWRLWSILASLVTDANAATRETVLQIDDGTTVYAEFPATQTQAASLTRRYQWADQRPFAGLSQYATIPVDIPVLTIPAGHRFKSLIQNGQVGDDWAAPQYLVEEWLEAL